MARKQSSTFLFLFSLYVYLLSGNFYSLSTEHILYYYNIFVLILLKIVRRRWNSMLLQITPGVNNLREKKLCKTFDSLTLVVPVLLYCLSMLTHRNHFPSIILPSRLCICLSDFQMLMCLSRQHMCFFFPMDTVVWIFCGLVEGWGAKVTILLYLYILLLSLVVIWKTLT